MLNRKSKYLQIALNNTLEDARSIIQQLPINNRILIEVGTPLIKRYGIESIEQIYRWWQLKLSSENISPYIVADLKTMDRGATEVKIATDAGASAAIGLGQAPIETTDAFISACSKYNLDSMVDMMNIDQPVKILRQLKKLPTVVLLHRGVDEETFNKYKPIPFVQINKVRASFNVMIAIAGGDTIREVQRAIFNDANIVVVWKEFYQASDNTGQLATDFLKQIK